MNLKIMLTIALLATIATNSHASGLKQADQKYANEQGMLVKMPAAALLKQRLEKEFCDFVVKTNIHNALANQELLPISVGTHVEFAFLTYSTKTVDKRKVATLKARKTEILKLILLDYLPS